MSRCETIIRRLFSARYFGLLLGGFNPEELASRRDGNLRLLGLVATRNRSVVRDRGSARSPWIGECGAFQQAVIHTTGPLFPLEGQDVAVASRGGEASIIGFRITA